MDKIYVNLHIDKNNSINSKNNSNDKSVILRKRLKIFRSAPTALSPAGIVYYINFSYLFA